MEEDMAIQKARIKEVAGGTIVEVYSKQQQRWYRFTEILPKRDALRLCQEEGFEVIYVR